MSFFRYLRENIRFIALYFALVAFLTAMVFLDEGTRLQPGNALYLAVVSCALFVGCVLADYGIRRRQVRRLAELADAPDRTPVLPEPADTRDALYARLIDGLWAQYRADIDRLEEDFRENKEFMTAWAHEIKTPITAAGLLLEGMEEGERRESLREELDRINAYVEKVLYQSRSDSFSKDYLIAEEALRPLVMENVKKHSVLFIRRCIRVTVDVGPELAVYTDRKWLLFILDQLLSNALKYTAAGGSVMISARQDGRETVLAYRDDGRGIRPQDLERVFAKSFTGRNGREPGSAATGLGLYLAQKLAHKLNHNITISSEYGAGTTAEIHFPLLGDFYNLTKM